eukprot:8513934-Ditylum_brightwellii.AAC.1
MRLDYPYNTLKPDWEVIAQSAEYLQGLGMKLTIEHAKSHQDNKHNFKQLDLPAQLNVSANKLVTGYRENSSETQ